MFKEPISTFIVMLMCCCVIGCQHTTFVVFSWYDIITYEK